MNGNIPNRREPERTPVPKPQNEFLIFLKVLFIIVGTLAVGIFVFGGLVLATCFLGT